ncbi:MAG: PEP-CTERM sorting domain-containing protein [Verrucomicrobiota bacterium]|nr:PEP-CTERM sorting domain-containing protein [Verrucomicrobiota bacterium]
MVKTEMRFAGISAILLFFAATAFAVVDANSTTNTSDPNDGSPWANVGSVNGASGEYLGNGWVLTAYHVGAGTITFDSGAFAWDGQQIRLTNADNTRTDLLLFHLTIAPNLAALSLSSSTPTAGSIVDMEGYGRIRGSDEKTYSTASGTYMGFDWSAAGAKSWGTNTIDSGGVTTINQGFGPVHVFSMDFSKTPQTLNEGEGALGDSGGAVFSFNGTTLELAGMMDAIGTFPNQPANTAVYGNETYAADITYYRNQIATVTGIPEPSTIWMLALGSTALGLAARSKRRRL